MVTLYDTFVTRETYSCYWQYDQLVTIEWSMGDRRYLPALFSVIRSITSEDKLVRENTVSVGWSTRELERADIKNDLWQADGKIVCDLVSERWTNKAINFFPYVVSNRE